MTTPATIYEVAARAGVSISTVSLAINHPARVSAKTRTLVLEAADELGFVPKERAIGRAKAGVGWIALVAPFSSYPSFAERMVGAMEALGPDGTQLVVFDHEDIATSDSPLLETLPVRGHVDGIVIMGIPLEDSAAERLAARLPTVLIDQKHPLLSSVWVDDFGGGQMVGARLLADGHRRVVFVRETETSFLDDSPAQQRANGLRSVLGADGVREITVSRTPSAGREVIDALRAFAAPALSFADDDFSVGVLELPYIFGTQPGRKPVWVFLVEQVRQMKGATLYPRGGTTMVTVRQVAGFQPGSRPGTGPESLRCVVHRQLDDLKDRG